MPSVEDTGGTNASIVENHQDSVDALHDAAANSVSSSNNSSNSLSVNVNNIKMEGSEKANDNETRSTDSGNSSTTNSTTSKSNELPIVPKQEPKFDDRHSDAEAAYEDSVEEMTIEDEEEEIDETDLSRPGPSHSDDSQNYGKLNSHYNCPSVSKEVLI